MIEGVGIKQLRVFADERGSLMEILRSDDDLFRGFGQIYTSTTYPGVIRAWHYHKRQDDFFAVLKGMIKLVLYDDRVGSATKGKVDEFFLGERSNILVEIPVEVIHGFKAIGTEPAILVNIPTEVYRPGEPDEYRIPWDSPDVPYDWAIRFK